MNARPSARLDASPRLNPWKALAVVLACIAVVHTIDHQVLAAAAAERAAQRRPAAVEPAPIYSRKCERRGMDTAATRADQQAWRLHCVPRRVLGA